MVTQGIRIKRGAQPGDELGHVDDLGHQTPGRLPGRVKLKLSVADHEQYLMANDNLYTVVTSDRHRNLRQLTRFVCPGSDNNTPGGYLRFHKDLDPSGRPQHDLDLPEECTARRCAQGVQER